jgi:hypothetical protein
MTVVRSTCGRPLRARARRRLRTERGKQLIHQQGELAAARTPFETRHKGDNRVEWGRMLHLLEKPVEDAHGSGI